MHLSVLPGVLASCAVCAIGVYGATLSADRPPTALELSSGSETPHSAVSRIRRVPGYGELPLSFEPNHGQRAADVAFVARGRGYELGLRANRAVLTLEATSGDADGRIATAPAGNDAGTASSLTMSLIGGRRDAQGSGIERLPGNVNYLVGADAAGWRTGIPTYRAVQFEDVYRGIDLVYYGNEGELEYDFLVEPGADPSNIALRFEGVDRVSLSAAGDLVLHTSSGQVRQHKPVIYQEIGGARHLVDGHYRLQDGVVSIVVGAYDVARPLVIDPVLVYSGYTGGTNRGEGIEVDAAGNAYVAGWTQDSGPRGSRDAFVMKINPAGTAVLYTTYVGGSGHDYAFDLAVDTSGSVYLTGLTKSVDFPTLQAFDFTTDGPAGGVFEGFVTRLAPDGSTFIYSSYLGSDSDGQDESGTGIAVHNGNAYVVGYTDGPGFPTTPDALQPTKPSPFGTFQAFFTKVGPTGALLHSTYLGAPTDTTTRTTLRWMALATRTWLEERTPGTSRPGIRSKYGSPRLRDIGRSSRS